MAQKIQLIDENGDHSGTTANPLKTTATLVTGDIEIGAVELKDGTTDARQTIRVDNATATATPTVAMAGAIYKASLDTYSDNDASPLHTDANGKLLTATTLDAETTKVIGTVNVAAAQSITAVSATAANLKCEATVAASQTIAVTQDTASSLKMTLGARGTYSVTAIDAVTLDADPTFYTSAAVTIAGYSRVGIFWSYDETEVGGGVTGTLTVEVSPDNTNWFSAPFFDTAGGATPQTSEVLSDDGTYICWLDRNLPFGYMRVKVTGANTDADDTILTSVIVYATT